MTAGATDGIEQVLASELAHGDAMIATARPILRHLLANDDHALFNDEIIAHLRGILGNIACQLLEAQARAASIADYRRFALERQEELTRAVIADPAFLSFTHALALEAQLARRLQERSGIDPVLSPLVQELVASKDPERAALAMNFLAAQARFIQQQRRMELPLKELPGDLFHKSLVILLSHAGEHALAAEMAAEALRRTFEESQSRLGLVSRLVMGMGAQAVKALAIGDAGLAFFATALSMASDQDRELVILSLVDRQSARLMLALRSAGLDIRTVEEQLLYFKPGRSVPEGFRALDSDRASALLAGSDPVSVL